MERIKGFTKSRTCYAIRADWLKKPKPDTAQEETEEQDANGQTESELQGR